MNYCNNKITMNIDGNAQKVGRGLITAIAENTRRNISKKNLTHLVQLEYTKFGSSS